MLGWLRRSAMIQAYNCAKGLALLGYTHSLEHFSVERCYSCYLPLISVETFPMPITVNGVEITDAAIHAETQHHPAPSPEIAHYAAKLALVAKELLLQEATRLEIKGDDGEARIAALIEQEIGEDSDEPSHHRAISEYLARLIGRATINGIDLMSASSPVR